MRSSLSCEASAAALRPYTSTASQLRLSGDPPDSLSRGTIRLNASRRAGCEGAREGLGSHAASLNDGLGWVHVQEAANPLLGFELWSVPQGVHRERRKWYECATGQNLTGTLAEENEQFDKVARRFRAYTDYRVHRSIARFTHECEHGPE